MPIVDAFMREMNMHGFMPYVGRGIVASYLVNDLGVDWRAGANYFEKMLIDYDAPSNYGNWARIAGLDTDKNQTKTLNVVL